MGLIALKIIKETHSFFSHIYNFTSIDFTIHFYTEHFWDIEVRDYCFVAKEAPVGLTNFLHLRLKQKQVNYTGQLDVFLKFSFFHRMLAVDHENVKPDITILGKALSGGVLPVSLPISLL